MELQNLPTRTDRKFKHKRLGRGYGSKVGGHTVGRGHKGQKSRSGHKSMVLFEGGNLPFYKRMPKLRGFKRNNKVENQPVNVQQLEENFSNGDTVTIDSLREKKLVRKNTTNVKILGFGEISKKLTIDGLALSDSAREKIVAAKGQINE